MLENSLRQLKMTGEDITKCLPDVIDAFVEFYGEDRREEITYVLNQVLIIKYTNTISLFENIDNVYSSLFNDIFGVQEKEIYTASLDILMLYLDIPLDNTNIDESLLKAIDENINTKEELLEGYRSHKYPKLDEFVEKYKQLKEELKPYNDELLRTIEKTEEIENKYYQQLREEFDYLIPEDKKDSKEYIEAYLGNGITGGGHAFDDSVEELLNNPNVPPAITDIFKEDRIEFFKANGIVINDSINEPTYEDYLKLPEVKELYDKARIVCEKISIRKKELYKSQSIECLKVQEDYIKNRKIIDEKNLVNKNDPLGLLAYHSKVCVYSTNFTFDGRKYNLSPIVLINAGFKGLDYTLIHELNHAIEDYIVSIENGICFSICGWDFSCAKIMDKQDNSEDHYNGITRKFELINEYVNERLSYEITQILHKNGKTVFGITDYVAPKYMVVDFLLNDFYNTFKSIIIKSRSNGNIDYLYNQLGMDNFNELNDLVNEFYEKYGFDGNAFSIVENALKDPKAKDADYIYSLIERKDKIINRMKEYNQNISIQKDSQL